MLYCASPRTSESRQLHLTHFRSFLPSSNLADGDTGSGCISGKKLPTLPVSFLATFDQYARDRLKLPIYTIRLPGVRCYVINDPALISAVERQPQMLSFAPIEANAAAATLGMKATTHEIMRRNPTASDGHFVTFHKAVRPALAPGSSLDNMVKNAVNVMESSLMIFQQKKKQNTHFFSWVRHEILSAVTEGEYGPGNPFRKPAFEQAWLYVRPTTVTSIPSYLSNQLSPVTFYPVCHSWQLAFFRTFSHGKASRPANILHALLKNTSALAVTPTVPTPCTPDNSMD